jgi:hypothetical protein
MHISNQTMGNVVVEYRWRIVGISSWNYDTAFGDANDVAVLESDCIDISEFESPFSVEFEILDCSADGYTYYQEGNACNGCTTDPILPCALVDKPTPDPARHASGSPFQFFWAAQNKWCQIVTAVEASHNSGCVEYKFICLTDGSKSSDWRSTASVAGTFYPNGTSQVPYQYWAQANYNQSLQWVVKYRDCQCQKETAQSAARTIFAPEP